MDCITHGARVRDPEGNIGTVNRAIPAPRRGFVSVSYAETKKFRYWKEIALMILGEEECQHE